MWAGRGEEETGDDEVRHVVWDFYPSERSGVWAQFFTEPLSFEQQEKVQKFSLRAVPARHVPAVVVARFGEQSQYFGPAGDHSAAAVQFKEEDCNCGDQWSLI